MPIVPALAEATLMWNKACEEANKLEPKRIKILKQLDAVRAEQQRIKNKALGLFTKARREQAITLTKWQIQYNESCSLCRYHLLEEGKEDKCWDRVAWLRYTSRKGDTPNYSYNPKQFWHLQIDREDICLEPDTKETFLTKKEAIQLADRILQEKGWILTDLENE